MNPRRRLEPPSLEPLSAIFNAPVTDPEEGEIWRATWASVVQLVLVTEVGDSTISAVPLSPDVEFADDETVVLDPGPPLTHSLGAWCGLQQTLPIRVLDSAVARVGPADLEAIRIGLGAAATVTSVFDDRHQVRTLMADRMAELAAASWLPSTAPAIELGERFRERGLTPSKLAIELGIAPGDVTALARGDRVPTRDQAEILSTLLAVEVEQLLVVRVDPDLVWALDRPKFRRRLAERGIAESEPDEAMWRLQMATAKLPVAARATGPSDPRRRWMGLIETYLDEG